jgi:ribosomal protein RSM22 (predicted rRNA methylase)
VADGRVKPPSRIHRGLTGSRELVGQAYLADPELRHEYEAEIAPRTAAALEHVWSAVALPEPRRVLDLGAGTGSAGRAVLQHWPGVELVSVDKVAGPGVIRADLARSIRPPGVEGRFDWVVAAHLINELALDLDGKLRLVRGWCRDLMTEDGACVLIEPALRETSRGLLALRDQLIAAGYFVVAPCLLQAPCPALARERDFCHASAGSIAQGRSRVDFSYLVVRRHGQACDDKDLFRVVSDPMKDKGRLRLFACGPAGRLLITRLDRDRSESNEPFDHLVRGDVVRLSGSDTRGDGLRCTEATKVDRL